MSNSFLDLENEIDMRRAIRAAYKHDGMEGLKQIKAELFKALSTLEEITEEIKADEAKGGR
jgi:hypothetical protein